MKLTNKDVVADCLAQIDAIQAHIRNVEAALYQARRLGRDDKLSAQSLFDALHSAELDLWRKVAMWGLTLDDADRDRIKVACAAMFMGPNSSVAEYVNRDGIHYASYLTADADEFRAMAARAFAPKG